MQVNEIFHSIQGEGNTVGLNVVFLRTSGCTLNCDFCDTKYHVKGKPMTVEQVVDRISDFPTNNVVVTGGEPLLFQSEILEVIKAMPAHNFWIETNGTLTPSKDLIKEVAGFNVSPKLSNSNNKKENAIINSALKEFALSQKAIFKFVVNGEEDIVEIADIQETVGIYAFMIYLMPLGTQKREIEKKEKDVIELCKKHGYNYSPRIHVTIYQGKKGV